MRRVAQLVAVTTGAGELGHDDLPLEGFWRSATASSSPTCSTIVTDPPPVDNLATSAIEVTFTPPLML